MLQSTLSNIARSLSATTADQSNTLLQQMAALADNPNYNIVDDSQGLAPAQPSPQIEIDLLEMLNFFSNLIFFWHLATLFLHGPALGLTLFWKPYGCWRGGGLHFPEVPIVWPKTFLQRHLSRKDFSLAQLFPILKP